MIVKPKSICFSDEDSRRINILAKVLKIPSRSELLRRLIDREWNTYARDIKRATESAEGN